MVKLEELLKEEQIPGTYILDTNVEKETVRDIVEKHGFSFFSIDGEKVTDKDSFLAEAQLAMHFPDYFGGNWDALNDCLLDFSWHPTPTKRYVIFYKSFQNFARQNTGDFLIAIQIMDRAAKEGSDNAKMYILLQGETSSLPRKLSQLKQITI